MMTSSLARLVESLVDVPDEMCDQNATARRRHGVRQKSYQNALSPGLNTPYDTVRQSIGSSCLRGAPSWRPSIAWPCASLSGFRFDRIASEWLKELRTVEDFRLARRQCDRNLEPFVVARGDALRTSDERYELAPVFGHQTNYTPAATGEAPLGEKRDKVMIFGAILAEA